MKRHSGSKAGTSEGQKEVTAAGAQEMASRASIYLGQESRVPKVWIPPNIHGGRCQGSDWLLFSLVRIEYGRLWNLWTKRFIKFWRLEIQDWSAMCGQSLVFHFDMLKNKST